MVFPINGNRQGFPKESLAIKLAVFRAKEKRAFLLSEHVFPNALQIHKSTPASCWSIWENKKFFFLFLTGTICVVRTAYANGRKRTLKTERGSISEMEGGKREEGIFPRIFSSFFFQGRNRPHLSTLPAKLGKCKRGEKHSKKRIVRSVHWIT